MNMTTVVVTTIICLTVFSICLIDILKRGGRNR